MENKLGPLSGKWYKALQTSAVTFWQQDVSKKSNGKQAWTTFRKVVQGPPNQRRHILVTGCVKKVQWKTSLDHFPESGTRPSKPAPSHFGNRMSQKSSMENKLGTTFRKVVQGPPNQRRHILVTGCVKKVQWKTSLDHFPESGTRPSKPAPSHFGDRLCQKSSMENKLGPLSRKWYKALQTSAVTFWQQDVSKKFNGKQAWTTFRKVVQGPPNQRRHILVTGCVKKLNGKQASDHFPESGTRPCKPAPSHFANMFPGKVPWKTSLDHFPESGTASKPAPSHFGDRLCQKSSMENKLGPLSRKWYEALPNQRRHILATGCVKKFNGKQAWTTFRKVVQGPPNQRRHILATGCLKKVQWKTSLDHFPESGTRPSKPAPSHFGDRLCQKSSMENKLGPLSGKWYKALQTSAVTFW